MANPVAWFEVVGKDGAKLRKFYGDLFGWNIDASDSGMDYGLVAAAEEGIGGGIGKSQDGGAGHLTVYIGVNDPKAYLAKAEKLGGHTILAPTEIPAYHLTFALFADPEGHMVGLMKGGI